MEELTTRVSSVDPFFRALVSLKTTTNYLQYFMERSLQMGGPAHRPAGSKMPAGWIQALIAGMFLAFGAVVSHASSSVSVLNDGTSSVSVLFQVGSVQYDKILNPGDNERFTDAYLVALGTDPAGQAINVTVSGTTLLHYDALPTNWQQTISLNNTLTHFWNFGNGTVYDSVGGVQGTLMGSAAVNPRSQLITTGGANANSYAVVGMNLLPTNTLGLTLMSWFKADATTTAFSRLFDLGGDANNWIAFSPYGDPKGYAGITIGGANITVRTPAGYNDGTYHSMALTLSATGGANGYGTMKVYIDGALGASADLTAAVNYSKLPTGPNNWFGRSETGVNAFSGALSEFRIYNSVLDANTISNLSSTPKIVVQPLDQGVVSGGTVTFSVTATGTALAYQWQLNGVNVSGAISSTLSLTNVATGTAGYYSVVVSNGAGTVTSSPANLTVYSNASSALAHQWSFNDNTANDYIGGCNGVTGGNAAVYNGRANFFGGSGTATYIALGSYPMPVTSTKGITLAEWFNVSATAGANSRIFDFGADTANFITFTPNSGTYGTFQLSVGGTVLSVTCPAAYMDGNTHCLMATLTATGGATGFGTIQVYIDGTAVGSVDMTSTCNYALLPYGPNNWFGRSQYGNGSMIGYIDDCRIYNVAFDPVTVSNVTAAGVSWPPVFTAQPASQSVPTGAEVNLTANVIGASPMTYQWTLNGTSIPGATNALYTIAQASAGNAGNYNLIASNVYGSSTSSTAVVTINAALVANDNLASATPLNPTWSLNNTDTAGTLTVNRPAWTLNGTAWTGAATVESGEPNHAGTNSVASVWFSYTTPATATSGELRITATNAPSVLAVYSGGYDAYYWPFEGNAVTATGYLPNVGGNPTYVSDSSPDPGTKSILFNGTTDYIESVDSAALSPTAYTIGAWVKVSTVRACTLIVRTSCTGGGGGCSTMSSMLRINSSGKFEHYTYDGSGHTVSGTTTVQPNTWYYVAAVGQNNGWAQLYVNGVQEGVPQSIGTLMTTGDRWVVAGNFSGFTYYNGEMDGLTIARRVFSPGQIAAMASGAPGNTFALPVMSLNTVASSTTWTLSTSLLPNTTYLIAMACPGNNAYDFPFTFLYFPPPTNDYAAGAAVLSSASTTNLITYGSITIPVLQAVYTTNGYLNMATADPGETAATGGSGSVRRSVWYSFTPSADGWFNLVGTNSSSLSSYLDVGQGSPSNFTNVTASTWSTSPNVSKKLTGGQTYLIRLWTSTSYADSPPYYTLWYRYYP